MLSQLKRREDIFRLSSSSASRFAQQQHDSGRKPATLTLPRPTHLARVQALGLLRQVLGALRGALALAGALRRGAAAAAADLNTFTQTAVNPAVVQFQQISLAVLAYTHTQRLCA